MCHLLLSLFAVILSGVTNAQVTSWNFTVPPFDSNQFGTVVVHPTDNTLFLFNTTETNQLELFKVNPLTGQLKLMATPKTFNLTFYRAELVGDNTLFAYYMNGGDIQKLCLLQVSDGTPLGCYTYINSAYLYLSDDKKFGIVLNAVDGKQTCVVNVKALQRIFCVPLMRGEILNNDTIGFIDSQGQTPGSGKTVVIYSLTTGKVLLNQTRSVEVLSVLPFNKRDVFLTVDKASVTFAYIATGNILSTLPANVVCSSGNTHNYLYSILNDTFVFTYKNKTSMFNPYQNRILWTYKETFSSCDGTSVPVVVQGTGGEELVFATTSTNVQAIVVSARTGEFIVNVSAPGSAFPYERFYFVHKLSSTLYWAQYQHMYLFTSNGKLVRTSSSLLFDYLDGGSPTNSSGVTVVFDATSWVQRENIVSGKVAWKVSLAVGTESVEGIDIPGMLDVSGHRVYVLRTLSSSATNAYVNRIVGIVD